jgi:acyl-coenzyme A thioesterase PaaI-like protein
MVTTGQTMINREVSKPTDDKVVSNAPSEDHSVPCYTENIEETISSLPLVRYLRSQNPKERSGQEPARFKEFRLHSNMEPSDFSAHLVSGSLYGQAKLPVHPRLFIQATPVCRVVAVCYIGSQLCGHPGYVHGGTLFALFDDIFARCAAIVTPSGVGMTANLNIDFRKPSIPDRFYIIRAEVARHEGRKVWVRGSIRCLPPVEKDRLRRLGPATTIDKLSIEETDADLVAEATALFVEPKFASVRAAVSPMSIFVYIPFQSFANQSF